MRKVTIDYLDSKEIRILLRTYFPPPLAFFWHYLYGRRASDKTHTCLKHRQRLWSVTLVQIESEGDSCSVGIFPRVLSATVHRC